MAPNVPDMIDKVNDYTPSAYVIRTSDSILCVLVITRLFVGLAVRDCVSITALAFGLSNIFIAVCIYPPPEPSVFWIYRILHKILTEKYRVNKYYVTVEMEFSK